MREINSDQDIMDILRERSAILKGHFLLSSGLHTDTYIQCAKLQEVPSICARLTNLLIEKVRRNSLDTCLNVDVVVAPAMGGIIFGYEIARQLDVNFVFLERVEGCFSLRRGFEIPNASRVLIVEDVITTGKSSLEVLDAVAAAGGKVVGELSIVHRSSSTNLPFPVVSLLTLDIKNYTESEMPHYLRETPITKPGSRYLYKGE